ncbi:hypothetical protein L1286_13010 [Pseudoalteromonas sp. SMS1]|uniref:hypothetical protein n=1 Tax=Pseudoalteromonas sp. SMS1 TaxID=2908894 RepID=UPI001F2A4FF3|nr:hypothetical protein [Pseudoalteromonas sp. SMS1]MCF2858401.1 hypothetical protein [Pseudoalteromonas sp. SMS1]
MKKLLLTLVPVVALSGCISPKTYVDPTFAKASYQDVKSVQKKYSTNVIVEFQRNGEAFERANKEVRNHVERTLRATGVIIPSNDNPAFSLKIVVNNLADLGEAAAKGFGTGLTFGAAGSLVTDYYEVSITYIDNSGKELTKKYKHALHTTIGNKKAPFENVDPTSPADAFGSVVEQVILNFITDMQNNGLLTFVRKIQPVHS